MRQVRDAGYEVGVHCFDHTTWQDFVSRRGEAWTRDQMLAEVLFSSGYLRGLRGEYAAGLNELRRAQTLFEQQQLPQHALAALDSIAIIYNRMGDYAEAAHLYERALEAQHKAGMKREEIVTRCV